MYIGLDLSHVFFTPLNTNFTDKNVYGLKPIFTKKNLPRNMGEVNQYQQTIEGSPSSSMTNKCRVHRDDCSNKTLCCTTP